VVARSKVEPQEPTTARRRPGVPRNEKVREYLDLEARFARVEKTDPMCAELDNRMKELLRGMNPTERRQLQIISRTVKP